jgi:streptolysin S family bacteriocin protoxin
MNRSREEILKEQERLIALQADAEKIFLQIPGVVGTAVGLKEVEGKLTEEIVFKVYVQKKKDQRDISQNEIIPEEILGVKTDVLEIGDTQLEDDESEYRPICGGIQITTEKSSSGFGTLGCLAIDNTNNDIVLLSNRHVLADNGEEVNDLVGQPGKPCDCCCCECCFIAKFVRATLANDTSVDAAIAKLSNGIELNYINEILEIGPVFGTAPAALLDVVRKRGRTTGLTEGTVASVSFNFTMTTTGINYTGQIDVSPNAPHPRFSAPGDSGSVYVNRLNQIIGLHFAGNGIRGRGNPIALVLSRLNISIPSVGTLNSIPLKSEFKEINNNASYVKEVSELVLQYEFGETLINLVKKHRVEVMHLINERREVKVAWNRYKGPVFVAHLMEKGKNREYHLPEEIEGISPQQMLIKMSVVLEKYGSQALTSDIEIHSTNILQLFQTILKDQCEAVLS